jgi:hypothetical protein
MDYSLAVKQALESPVTLATPLLAVVRKSFGDDAFLWDPTTIYLECRDQFAAEPAAEAMDRISAGQVVIAGNGFFEDISAFLNICNTLAGGSPAFGVFDPVEPEEAAWALLEVSLLRDMLPFAPTIRDYVRTILVQDGYSADQHPIFGYVLGGKMPPLGKIVEQTLHDDQRDNVDNFIAGNMEALVYQMNQIPGMDTVLLELLHDKDLEDLASLVPPIELKV